MTDQETFQYQWPPALYRLQTEPDYAGNPFIEALPTMCDDDGAILGMQNLIRVTEAERSRPPHERLHMLGRFKHFMQPLDYHVGLFHRMAVALRRGYVERNPVSPGFIRQVIENAELLKQASANLAAKPSGTGDPVRQRIGAGSGLTLLGPSGIGKSTAVEAVLRCYAQVIPHVGLRGPLSSVHQIVWLKLSVPTDGSLKALCIDFFAAIDEVLGTNYYRLYVTRNVTRDHLAVLVGRVAFIHGLGMLVIDELQNLNVAKSGGADVMMNFFKLLRDVMKIPLLTVGTPEALAILSSGFQTARRNSGLEPMEPMRHDDQFRFFCESLFDAQFLRLPISPTAEIVNLLYRLSQGITDVVVQLFVLAQNRALSIGEETLTQDLFVYCYEHNMSLMHSFLDEMRRGKRPGGKNFDRAIVASNAAVFPPPPVKPAAAADGTVQDAPPDPIGVKARRLRKVKGAPSTCLYVRVVADGALKQVSPHQALADAGLIRSLGAEALAQ